MSLKIAYADRLDGRPVVAVQAVTAVLYALVGLTGILLFHGPLPAARIYQGLRLLWNPGIILLCQILWIGIFLYMGRSQVTGARISFHVRKDRI